jgi:hypothetical protein
MLSSVQGEYVKLLGGRGQPRSRTSRNEQRTTRRDSPAAAGECGCPLPLSLHVAARVALLASCAAWYYCAREISFDSGTGDTPRIGQIPSIVCITKRTECW